MPTGIHSSLPELVRRSLQQLRVTRGKFRTTSSKCGLQLLLAFIMLCILQENAPNNSKSININGPFDVPLVVAEELMKETS